MRGPGLVGYEPTSIRWSYDAAKLYFQWKRYTDPIEAPMDTYVINRDGSDLRKLSDDEARLAPPVANEQGRFAGGFGFGGGAGGGPGELSKDRKWTVYTQSGDLFLYDNEHGVRRQLTKTGDVESQPHFLHHQASQISFVRGGNLFVLSLDPSSTQPMLDQLTDIQTGGGGAAGTAPVAVRGQGGGRQGVARGDDEKKGTDSQEYLKKEERALLEINNYRAKLREEQEAKRKKENPRKPYTLAARQSVATLPTLTRW